MGQPRLEDRRGALRHRDARRRRCGERGARGMGRLGQRANRLPLCWLGDFHAAAGAGALLLRGPVGQARHWPVLAPGRGFGSDGLRALSRRGRLHARHARLPDRSRILALHPRRTLFRPHGRSRSGFAQRAGAAWLLLAPADRHRLAGRSTRWETSSPHSAATSTTARSALPTTWRTSSIEWRSASRCWPRPCSQAR